jgi:malate dehydrogenase (oxaloacetate-decarboxylating)(NADP+)
MESGVARQPITDWDKYIESLEDRLGTGNKLMRMITSRAKAKPKKVLFAEADELDVLKAAQIVYEEGIAEVVLLGDKKTIHGLMKELSFDEDIEIIDPKSKDEEHRRNVFADQYWKQRQRKGLTLLAAQKQMRERNYFAAMMVNNNMADVLVTGYTSTYPTVAKPMIELIGKQDDVQRVSATNIMLTERGPLFLSDTAMLINPTAEELVEIAHLTYKMMKLFGVEPNIAMLSYSNFSASKIDSVKKVQQAVKILHERFPHISIDGGLQADFALNEVLRSSKFPFTKIEGKKVNGLIFPNLESANISYKLIKELNKTESVGPIIMGLKKPVHLIQLRASVDEIVNIVSVAVVDAQEKEKLAKSKANKK